MSISTPLRKLAFAATLLGATSVLGETNVPESIRYGGETYTRAAAVKITDPWNENSSCLFRNKTHYCLDITAAAPAPPAASPLADEEPLIPEAPEPVLAPLTPAEKTNG